MPTNAALVSALQRPLSALVLVLQQPPSPVSPCSHHTATLVTDPAITALAVTRASVGEWGLSRTKVCSSAAGVLRVAISGSRQGIGRGRDLR